MATEQEAELISSAYAAGITSAGELANFMAQVTQESLGLTRLNESFVYSKGLSQIPVRSVRNNPIEGEMARLEALHGHPEKLAEMMYGGRMGNDLPGDGFKYRGRGYIQLTGKDNYRAAGEALGLDLLSNPDLAATRANAVQIAIWFWRENVHDAAPEDIDRATHIINVGNEGIVQRRQYFEDWQNRLTPDVIEDLAQGEARLPIGQRGASHRNDASYYAQNGVVESQSGNVTIGELQTHLRNLGYTDAQGRPLVIDGQFGKRTGDAIEAFQRDHGLVANGVADPKTWAALHDAAREASIDQSPIPTLAAKTIIDFPQMAPPDLDAIAISTLQQQLQTLGMTDHRGQPLPVTGNYDEITRNAVMMFQKELGLPGTGLPDPAMRALIDARATIAELQHVQRERPMPLHKMSLNEGIRVPMEPPVAGPDLPQPTATASKVLSPDNAPIPKWGQSALLEPASIDPRHESSPQYALFSELRTRIPEASEQRLLQFTAACYVCGITDQNLDAVRFDREGGFIHFGACNDLVAKVATVDVKQPSPQPAQSIQLIQQYDHGQMQLQARIATQNQAQQGPMPGGSFR